MAACFCVVLVVGTGCQTFRTSPPSELEEERDQASWADKSIVKALAKHPDWELGARDLAAKRTEETIGLMWTAFPDLNDPIHVEIWRALRNKGRIGDGWGAICQCCDHHLVTVSESFGHGRLSSFYDSANRWVFSANEQMAFTLYCGDKTAGANSVRRLMEHLLAVHGYEAFIVNDCNEIPHTRFLSENPGSSFSEFLEGKGIVIRPLKVLANDDPAVLRDHYQESVFAYMPCGGQLFRYDIHCAGDRIVRVQKFLVAEEIGDCWFIL